MAAAVRLCAAAVAAAAAAAAATPTPTLLSSAAPPAPGTRVLGEHLSLGGTPSPRVVVVAWHTDGPVGPAEVRWRPADDDAAPTAVAAGVTAVYLVSANRSAFVHHATIGPLTPGARYSYQAAHSASVEAVSDPLVHVRDRDGPAGAEHTFLMPSAAGQWGPQAGPTRIVFFGDSGNSKAWSGGTVPAVAAEVAAGGVSAVVHTGDMAYYADADDGQRGGTHEEELANATGHVAPLMTVVGNADVFCYRPRGIPPWAACTEDYQRRYIMPGWNKTHSLWSSFSVGPVHVVLLDSEAKTWCNANQNHTQQRAFMEADLAAVDRSKTPWVVAVVHRPLYTSCLNGREQQSMRDGFADLFLKHRVDAVLSGHMHSYERTFPVAGNYTNATNATVQTFPDPSVYTDPAHPVYVVSGAAGCGEGVDDCSKNAAVYNWTFSAARSNDVGFSSLRAHNATHLEFDHWSVTQSRRVDHFWVVRSSPPLVTA